MKKFEKKSFLLVVFSIAMPIIIFAAYVNTQLSVPLIKSTFCVYFTVKIFFVSQRQRDSTHGKGLGLSIRKYLVLYYIYTCMLLRSMNRICCTF